MFLSGLSLQERVGFAGLAHELAHADGRLAAEEKTVIDRLRSEAGLYDDDRSPISFSDALASIADAPQRRAAFLELVGICWSDGMIADEEAVLLDRIADAWSIDARQRSAVVDWVKRQTDLLDEARAIIMADD